MVPPPKPLASCRGTDLVATVKGPLSRVADSSAAVMTLSGIQFDGTAGIDTGDVIATADAIGVDTILDDCS